jgi:SPP1 gp7 family putative phage head morphogenesis protein
MSSTAKKRTTAKNTSLVVNNITIRPINRSTADIDTWRNALKAADKGKRKALYDLYEDLLIDMTLSDSMEKRIEAITNAELVFKDKNGDPVDEIDRLMETEEFEEFLTEAMKTKFWGYTVVEFDFANGFKPYFVPRKHILIDRGEIAMQETDEAGTPYRDSDFFLEIGYAKDYGLIYKAAPYVIYKRGGFGDWAQYVEIFGMPFRIGKYNNYDEATRQELIKALEQAGSAAIAVIPKEGDIEYRDNKSSGSGEIYDNLRKACNEEILIGILGQTMTTLNGSSKSQGEVHLEVQENKHKSDRKFIQRILNHKLLPLLEKRGWPVAGGYWSFPEAGETVPMVDRVGIIERATKMVKVPAWYVYDALGIPQPKEDDELAENPTPGFGGGFGNEPDDPDDTPENRLTFFQRLFSFFGYAPQDGALNGNHPTNAAVDEPGDDFDTLLIKRVARGEAAYFDRDLFLSFAGKFSQVLQEKFKARNPVNTGVGIEYGVQNDAVTTAMETNLFHFSAAKTLAELQQLNQLYRESKSLADYLGKARQLAGKFNETWARTEYNTAGLVAESSATYHRLKGQVDLFPYWEYRTVGDDKVRDAHQKLDGVILHVNDPRWKKLYPPNDWNCRCYVIPRMRHEVIGVNFEEMQARVDEYLGTPEHKTSETQGFATNRAESNEVFSGNQFYIRKFPNKAAKYLDRLGAADFDLKGVSKYKAEAAQTVPRYIGTPEEWFAARAKDRQVVLEDRNGRKLILPEKGFRTHTTGSHAGRTEYLESLPQTLKAPDEVWINNQRPGAPYDNYTLIKYYQDEVVVVCCRVTKGNVNEVVTWFPLRMKKEVITKHRRGLLVYKKASE